MNESIYGPHAATLPLVMGTLVQAIERFQDQYRHRYGQSPYEHFLHRVKGEESMREKCARKGLPATPHSALWDIHDAVGLRIVTHFVDDIYALADYLRRLDHVTIVEEKDYIRTAKPNGYRSYHIVLLVEVPYEDVLGRNPGQFFAELQLRTIAMDSWAALEHEVTYKKNLNGVNLELVRTELKRCADELASCDLSMMTIRNLVREQTEENHETADC